MAFPSKMVSCPNGVAHATTLRDFLFGQILKCAGNFLFRRVFVDDRGRRRHMRRDFLSHFHWFSLLMNDVRYERATAAVGVGFLDAEPIPQHQRHVLLKGVG